MRPHDRTLRSQDVCREVLGLLETTLGWTSRSAVVTSSLLIRLLVRAAAEMRSLSAIVQDAQNVPSAEAVRTTLHEMLPKTTDELLPTLTGALHARLPEALARRPRTMAVDLHLKPYYGDRGTTSGTYRGQHKAGTKTFFAYATLLVIDKGHTYTVGLVPVVNGQEQSEILRALLEQAAAVGLRCRCLLLDRGFYAATTIAWLQANNISFVMPMIRRGEAGNDEAECTGTAGFFRRDRHGWDQHTWVARPRRGGRKQPAVKVTVDVCMAPREGEAPLVFACHGIQRSPGEIAELYRSRFQIETSYRQMHEGLARTCTKSPVVRLLLVGIAFVLRNVWVWLHGTQLAKGHGDEIELRHELMRLRRMMRWLMIELDQELGAITCVHVSNLEGASA